MRYLGSKVRILPFIDELIKEQNITGDTFADLFAGTGSVGDYFKDRYKIIANDFMVYSYLLNLAKLENSKIPTFKKFKKEMNDDIFNWLNSQKYIPDDSYFIYKNYTPLGGRYFFTENNGIKIDGVRIKIEDLKRKNLINDDEYTFLIASLIESITKYSNTSGTFEAFLKFWDSRALKDFAIEALEINQVKIKANNEIYNENTNDLIRKIEGDIAYIDTPYTVTQYVSAYHLLETIALYDSPKIKGVGGKRDRGNKNSLYARKNAALEEFEDLFRQLRFTHVIISYSNQGLVPTNELIDLAKKFAVNNEVIIKKIDYQEYQNHRSSRKGNGQSLHEVLIYFKKDYQVRKSPLNYSGSKDSIFPLINSVLPKHVGCFVDVMGGAFNVGLNVVAMDSVIYNEIEPHIFDLVKWLLTGSKAEIINQVEESIKFYKMDKGAKEPYDCLRNKYNNDKNSLDLFLLHMYSFQNIIRFNKDKQFNTPIGVAGYSEDLKKRIMEFYPKTQNIIFTNKDYLDIKWEEFSSDTIFYFDPPYYITKAAYNDGKRGGKGWGRQEELELLDTLDKINVLGYKFILSNVIEHKGKKHTLLIDWAKKNNYKILDVGISGWRYEKNEILIKNY